MIGACLMKRNAYCSSNAFGQSYILLNYEYECKWLISIVNILTLLLLA